MFRKFEPRNETRDYIIRLTAMDENYYDYFVVGESGEYSNALLNYPTLRVDRLEFKEDLVFLVRLHPIDCY